MKNLPAEQSSPISINQIFSHIVCLNLDRRPQRWTQMQDRFAQQGISSVKRFSAVDGNDITPPSNWTETNGAYGCLLSHVQMVQQAQHQGYDSILIFEDDAVFDERFTQKFSRYIQQLPDDWDMLMLGGLHFRDPLPFSADVRRINQCHSTYAYALKSTIFAEFIASNTVSTIAVDENNLLLQKKFNCYCFMPNLVWVESLYSDIQERVVDHWHIQQSLVMRGEVITRQMEQTLIIIMHTNRQQNPDITKNLLFLTHIYSHRSPHIRLVVVEQDSAASVDPAALPDNCQYLLIADDSEVNVSACFNAAIKHADSDKNYFIFVDGDVFIEECDMRCNIGMCQQHGAATGFSQLIQLNHSDTQQLYNDKYLELRWLTSTDYIWQPKDNVFDRCCYFNRHAFEAMGGWDENHINQRIGRKTLADAQFTLFESPNNLIRLSSH